MKIYKCKNCGHPIIRLFWLWCFHVQQYNKYRKIHGHITKKCEETSDCGCPYPKINYNTT